MPRSFVTQPTVKFAKGTGRVSFSEFAGWHTRGGVVIHTTKTSTTDVRVAVCLFGSLDNTADYVGARDKFEAGSDLQRRRAGEGAMARRALDS